MVQGTKGLFQGYPNRVYIEGRGKADQWQEASTTLLAEFEHPLWKEIAAQAQGAGHGGMDFIEDYRLIKCLREGTPTDMNVYDAAALSAVVALSVQSVAQATARRWTSPTSRAGAGRPRRRSTSSTCSRVRLTSLRLGDRHRVDRRLVHPGAVLRRAAPGRSTAEFFTSGRAAPWWLIGVSMVATTFSTDTPNLVTNLVRERRRRRQLALVGLPAHRHDDGVLLRAALAPLGRAHRSRVLRDPLFRARRRRCVRGFRAVYLGFFFNCVIMATVNLAAAKIAQRAARLADGADAARLRA